MRGESGANAQAVQAVGDYAVIGDGRSAALVSSAGSVDWLCWPRFDSDALFAEILDDEKGGHWRIQPSTTFRVRRQYLPDTNVLVTEFQTETGRVRLIDFMAVRSVEQQRTQLFAEHELVRVVEGLEGEVPMAFEFHPAPHYARAAPRIERRGGLGLRVIDGRSIYTLQSQIPLPLIPRVGAEAHFVARADETYAFVLSFDADGPAVLVDPRRYWPRALQETTDWWRGWASQCTYNGPYREAVVRSALALKLLSFAPSGAIVAAPTTSLPEVVGGRYNWDYRYCWLRDAALTVRSYFDLGYAAEAEAFVSWLLHATRLTRPELRVLYDVYGGVPDEEEELSHLAGHRGSLPVRIGNAAASQRQLDVYGEVIDAVAQLVRRGETLDRTTQSMLNDFGRYVCHHFHLPDHGIWELREEPQHHTHSKLMCWVALERLLELHRRGAIARLPVGEVERHRAILREQIEQRAYNASLQSYTRVFGGDTVDASVLLMSWYGFENARSARMRSTFSLIEARLSSRSGLVYRSEELRATGEGAFTLCSFWACEFIARGGGTLREAENRFEALLATANDVGLLAEETDPRTLDAVGNFPQAFSHLGLVSAALAIEERRASETVRPPLTSRFPTGEVHV